MASPPGISRVILVVLDGLRADAVSLYPLRTLERLAAGGAATFAARTVAPSVTAAAMTSLFTGVAPSTHGLASDRFGIPHPKVPLQPLPRILRDAGHPTFTFMARLPRAYGRLAMKIAEALGVHRATFDGTTAPEILTTARTALTTQRRGLFVFHWPDADRAGHADGWMSRRYMLAAHRLDESLALLDALTGASRDPDTLLIVLADHGGGGDLRRNHESNHPHDRTIPIVLAGGAVTRGELAPLTSLLDVPATVTWALGIATPPTYEGRALVEAFATCAPSRQAAHRYPAVATA